MTYGRFINDPLLVVLDVSFFSFYIVFVIVSVLLLNEHQMDAVFGQFRVLLLVDDKNCEYEDTM